MSFPDRCVKGIPNEAFVAPEGIVGAHLFYFKVEGARDDGWIEQSINWEDNETVIEFTLNQTRETGEIQFRVGVVTVPRERIDELNARPVYRDLMSYERQPLPDNPYHGNLLLRETVSKPMMKLLAAHLAMAASEVIPQG
jgi:hypothetical protein